MNPRFTYYTMEFKRVADKFEFGYCIADTTTATIDLSEYHSRDSPFHCHVGLHASWVTMDRYFMPWGVIMLTVRITDKRNNIYIKRGFFKVVRDHVDVDNVLIRDHTTPSASAFSTHYSGTNGLTIDYSQTYFPYLLPSFGHHPYFPIKPRHVFNCSDSPDWRICGNIASDPEATTIKVSPDELQAVAMNGTGQHVYQALWSFELAGEVYSHTFNRTIYVSNNSIQVEIKCLRNCLSRLITKYPALWVATCPLCDWSYPNATYSYLWSGLPDNNSFVGSYSRYLSIVEPVYEDFKVRLTVQVKVGPEEFTGFAEKIVKVARNDTRVNFDYTAIISLDTDSAFQLFAIKLSIFDRVQDKRALPMKLFLEVEQNGQDFWKYYEVSSFISPMNNVAFYMGNKDWLEAYIGLRTADGTTTQRRYQVQKVDYESDGLALEERCNLDAINMTYG
ncbi:hypothetical protein EGW08_021291, partial [Elysia chlorotica]